MDRLEKVEAEKNNTGTLVSALLMKSHEKLFLLLDSDDHSLVGFMRPLSLETA